MSDFGRSLIAKEFYDALSFFVCSVLLAVLRVTSLSLCTIFFCFSVGDAYLYNVMWLIFFNILDCCYTDL